MRGRIVLAATGAVACMAPLAPAPRAQTPQRKRVLAWADVHGGYQVLAHLDPATMYFEAIRWSLRQVN